MGNGTPAARPRAGSCVAWRLALPETGNPSGAGGVATPCDGTVLACCETTSGGGVNVPKHWPARTLSVAAAAAGCPMITGGAMPNAKPAWRCCAECSGGAGFIAGLSTDCPDRGLALK